jgi:hypothetical protein
MMGRDVASAQLANDFNRILLNKGIGHIVK